MHVLHGRQFAPDCVVCLDEGGGRVKTVAEEICSGNVRSYQAQ